MVDRSDSYPEGVSVSPSEQHHLAQKFDEQRESFHQQVRRLECYAECLEHELQGSRAETAQSQDQAKLCFSHGGNTRRVARFVARALPRS